ncbi:MAG: hypothetical protein JJE04_27805 [Acidobacteriia bacterium]|nr:hypothetical protein [Terriglobia bacterium]
MPEYHNIPVGVPEEVVQNLRKFHELFDVADDVANLGQRILDQLRHERDGTGFHSDLETASYVLFGKGFKTFLASQILCRSGCGADALGLCGSLFENWVDLMYIRQAPVRRAQRYLRYEQIDKYYQALKVLRRKRLPKGTRGQYKGHLSALAPQVKQLLKTFREQSCWVKVTRRQAGRVTRRKMGLRDRAEAVKLGVEYDTQYYMLCGFKHTGAAAAFGFMFEHDQGVDVIVGPNVKGVFDAIVHSTRYFLEICGVYQDIHGLGVEAEVNALKQRLIETSDQVVAAHTDLCE